ncbi:MAG: 50S ribosomal protein L15 [Candidatus Saccharimonadales bacterium]
MKYHELDITSSKTKKRVGRGIGSGRGKTAGRGTKGQNSRTGGGVRPGFEGGQNPLLKRLPKVRGFKAPNKKIALVHTDQLNDFRANSTIGKEQLHSAGLISKPTKVVKLLHRGEVGKAITVSVDYASAAAIAALEAAGGSFKKDE